MSTATLSQSSGKTGRTRPASNAEVMDLVGRQRMLNQRHLKQVAGHMLGVKTPMDGVRSLLRETIEALASGGVATLVPGKDPVMVEIAPPATPKLREVFELQADRLQSIEQQADEIMGMKTDDPRLGKSLERLFDAGQQLHQIMDGGVREVTAYFAAMDKEAEKLKEALIRIEKLMVVIKDSAEGVSSSSEEAASIAKQTSMETSENLATLEELSAAMEEIQASTDQVCVQCDSASKICDEFQSLRTAGESAVEKNRLAIDAISKSAGRITEIVDIISQIASHTNLLALNAAIEAARAGQHGLGFAVVADEVRKLADRAAGATREIRQLIKDTVANVHNGEQSSSEMVGVLRHFVTDSQNVTDSIHHTTAGTIEVKNTLKSVVEGLMQLNKRSQGTAASTESLAKAAEQLLQQSHRLLRVTEEQK